METKLESRIKLLIHFISYLSVEKAIKKGCEKALKGDKKSGDHTPKGKVNDVLAVRGGHHLKAVGDAQ